MKLATKITIHFKKKMYSVTIKKNINMCKLMSSGNLLIENVI